MSDNQKRMIWAVVLFGICTFLVISFLSYNPDDIAFNTSNPNTHIRNFSGNVGAYMVWALLFSVGWSSYFLPLLFCFWAVGKIMGRASQNIPTKFFGFFFVIWSFSAMMSTITSSYNVSRVATGGVLGFYTSMMLMKYFGEIGTMIILSTIFLLSLLLATEFLIVPVVLQAAKGVLAFFKALAARSEQRRAAALVRETEKPRIRRLRERAEAKERKSAEVRNRAKEPEPEEEPAPQKSFFRSKPLIKKA